jgi:hypothetical protein
MDDIESLVVGVSPLLRAVVVVLPKPVQTLTISPEQAIEFAKILLETAENARSLQERN